MYKTSKPIYVIGGKYAREESDWLPILETVPGRFQLVTGLQWSPALCASWTTNRPAKPSRSKRIQIRATTWNSSG